MLPYYPMPGREGAHQYTTTSWGLNLVASYTGLSFHEVRELDYVQYLIWRRDAFISRMDKTEEGRAYLDNAWRLEQTEPDRKALRKKLRKEEKPRGS